MMLKCYNDTVVRKGYLKQKKKLKILKRTKVFLMVK